MKKINCNGWLVADLECSMHPESHSSKFYARAKKMLCVVTKEVVTGEVTLYTPGQEKEMIEALLTAPRLVMHFGRGFDLPALGNIFPEHNKAFRAAPLVDTLFASREMFTMDELSKSDKTYGYPEEKALHSLRAWGRRLGFPKMEDFAEADWINMIYTDLMGQYCKVDVSITEKLFKLLLKKKGYEIG